MKVDLILQVKEGRWGDGKEGVGIPPMQPPDRLKRASGQHLWGTIENHMTWKRSLPVCRQPPTPVAVAAHS